MPALGWDGLNPEGDEHRRQLFMLENQNRRRLLTRVDNRSPFPPGFMVGTNRDTIGGESCSLRTCLLLLILLFQTSAATSPAHTVRVDRSPTRTMARTRFFDAPNKVVTALNVLVPILRLD